MNDWRGMAERSDDGCPLACGIVETVGRVGVNRRSSPIYSPDAPEKNVVGGWPDDTLLMVWEVQPAIYPPGHWLYCQALTGDVELTWVHGANVRAGRLL